MYVKAHQYWQKRQSKETKHTSSFEKFYKKLDVYKLKAIAFKDIKEYQE